MNASNDLLGEIRAAVDRLAASHLGAPRGIGLAVGVVAGGQPRVLCYGAVAGDSGRAPDERTVYEIGSVGKLLTANLLAEMAARGEVALDDPIEKHFRPPIPLPTYGGQSITLEHLATHTSGLPRLPGNIGQTVTDPRNPYANYSFDHLCAYLSKCRLSRRPGAKVVYSNLGMGLLGDVLGQVHGKPYEATVIERVCRLLGMNDTTVTLSDDQKGRLAQGHSSGGKPVPLWDSLCLQGDGAHRSTLADMLAYAEANLRADGPLAEPLRACHEPRYALAKRLPRAGVRYGVAVAGALAWLGAYRAFGWSPGQVPGIGAAAVIALGLGIPFFFGTGAGLAVVALLFGGMFVLMGHRPGMLPTAAVAAAGAWLMSSRFRREGLVGLGWHLSPLHPGGPTMLWHNGGTGGFASFLGLVKASGTAVVVLSNEARPVDDLAIAVLRAAHANAADTSRDGPAAAAGARHGAS